MGTNLHARTGQTFGGSCGNQSQACSNGEAGWQCFIENEGTRVRLTNHGVSVWPTRVPIRAIFFCRSLQKSPKSDVGPKPKAGHIFPYLPTASHGLALLHGISATFSGRRSLKLLASQTAVQLVRGAVRLLHPWETPKASGKETPISTQMAMGQNPVAPQSRLKWVVHLPQNGTICFDPQPNVWVQVGHLRSQALRGARNHGLAANFCWNKWSSRASHPLSPVSQCCFCN